MRMLMKPSWLFYLALSFLNFYATGVCAGPIMQKYNRAVQDASQAEANEISNSLDAVTPGNDSLIWNDTKTLLKVVSWKSQSDVDKYILPNTSTSDNEEHPVWVSLAPKVQEFCRHYLQTHPGASQAQLELRLKQHLGLNPDWQYDVFVEMWVSPSALFRPCVDPDVNDSSCELTLSNAASNNQSAKISDYPKFYRNLYYKSFRESRVPWTGLGYTYDWYYSHSAPLAKRQGVSEFILYPGASYVNPNVVSTMQYCQPLVF